MLTVSIVIPSYNRPELLERAIKSVENQTYSDIEIIVIDDNSDISIKDVEKRFKNVRFFKNKTNKGPCFSRNRGLKEAKGRYINFLDDDDILFPGKIEMQVQCFEKSNDPYLGVVTCHTDDCRSGKSIIRYNQYKGDIYKKLLSKFLVSGIETMLFKKDYLKEAGGFDDQLQSSQEYDLLIRLTEKYTIDFVDEVLTKEYRSSNQINLNFSKKINGAKYLYSKHDSRYRSFGILFWLKMRLKLNLLIVRFYIGKLFGEKVYRMLIR